MIFKKIILHRWDTQGGHSGEGLEDVAEDVDDGDPKYGPKEKKEISSDIGFPQTKNNNLKYLLLVFSEKLVRQHGAEDGGEVAET